MNFPECFRGPLKTLWRATYGLRAANYLPLTYTIADPRDESDMGASAASATNSPPPY